MNAPTAKDQFSFSLGQLTYIDSTYDDEFARAWQRKSDAWPDGSAAWWPEISEWQRQRAVMQEMAMMTDRELSDIGLSRADLARVFDPTFAANHARGRDYIAY